MSDDTDRTIHESKRKRSRNGIATYLRRMAAALRRGRRISADKEQTVTVEPPAEADFEVELEHEDDTVSLELGMEWDGTDEDIETDAAASKATFELFKDAEEKHRWRLIHDNGNIIADGSEGYASKQKAKQGLESVMKNAPGGHVVDQSKGEEAGDAGEGGSNATFELFKDAEGKHRWRLVHDNGNIISDSGQGYASKQKAKQGLQSVKMNVPGATVEDAE